ncbi:hypothetical protein Tco_1408196, partial [Tanacetum coccineum]
PDAKVECQSRGSRGRGRKLPNNSSSSSVRSYLAPPPLASQAGLEKFVEKFVVAHNEQVKDILSQLADKNIELRLPVPLNNNQFMDDVIDEGDESNEVENVDYPELIWEDVAFQIDHKKEKKSRRQIPPKKSIDKGSQGKKTIDDPQETMDVSEESEPELEHVKKKTSSKRRVKKKVTLSADDNIISDDPDTALKLGKSISLTEAEEAEVARKVHVTHARIVTESVYVSAKKKSGGISPRSVTIQDTPSTPKSKLATSKSKLKGVQSLPPSEQEVAYIMQALKESKKTSKRQPGTGCSSEGTGTIPWVLDKSTVISATSSEGTGTKPGVPDEEKDISEEKVILEWGSEEESDDHICDTHDADDEDAKTESNEDDIYKCNIRVRKDEDLEMTNAKVKDFDKGDEEVTNAAKADAEKTSEVKDDAKNIVKDTIEAEINSLLEVKIQSEVPHIQSLSMLSVPVSVISEPSVLTPVQESPSIATVTTQLPPSVSTTQPAPQQTTTPIPIPPITTMLQPSPLLCLSKGTEETHDKYYSEIFSAANSLAEKQETPKYTIKSTNKAALEEYDQNSTLYQTMHRNKSFNGNPTNYRLYHALMEALIEDKKAMDRGVTDTVIDYKRKHDDDEDDDDDDKDPPAGPKRDKQTRRKRNKESESSKKPSSTKETPKGKAPSKGSKSGKSASAKEPVEEPIVEVVMDDVGEKAVPDDDQP